MNLILYFSGYSYFLFILVKYWKKYALQDALLLVTVGLIPLGKLFYLHVPMLIGFKFCFLFLCACIGVLVVSAFYRSVSFHREVLFVFGFLLPALISILFLSDPKMLISYQAGEEQTDSVLARLFSFMFLLIFSAWTSNFVIKRRDGLLRIAESYLSGLLFTCSVGYFIFAGVYNSLFTIDDLLPISADTHLIGNIYRFNPGANVNEFGMLLGYGILFVMWRDWTTRRKTIYLILFSVAEFLTLTRASWIGVLLGVGVYLLRAEKNRIKYAVVAICLVSILLGALALNEKSRELLTSRSSFEIGASGEERLEKYSVVYQGLSSSPIRLLFGFGWSTNLYVHSVPLQILYETGLVGSACFVISWAFLILRLLRISNSKDLTLLLGLFTMLFTFSMVHHTFYHMQSWLLVGLACGAVVRDRHRTSIGVPAVSMQ